MSLAKQSTHEARLKRALSEIKVRFARDAEGSIIAQMVHSSHDAVPNCSWAKIYPNWIVTESDGEIIGCVQLCYSTPIARLEFLSFVPGLAYRKRALSMKAMLATACTSLKRYEASAVACFVPFAFKSFKDILINEGCTVVQSGNMLVRSCG